MSGADTAQTEPCSTGRLRLIRDSNRETKLYLCFCLHCVHNSYDGFPIASIVIAVFLNSYDGFPIASIVIAVFLTKRAPILPGHHRCQSVADPLRYRRRHRVADGVIPKAIDARNLSLVDRSRPRSRPPIPEKNDATEYDR